VINLKTLLMESGPSTYIGYHGTGVKFRRFNLDYSTMGVIWFTSNKQEILDGNVGANGRGYIVTAELTIKNPAGWKEYDLKSIAELKRDGYDGVILNGSDSQDVTYMVWNTKQIKILKVEDVSGSSKG
jgi:hypothetical protein